MAEIRSSGFEGGDIVTTHQPPESVRDWVERHQDAYKQGVVDNSTITTTWPQGCSNTTYQQTGESTALHHARHWESTAEAMSQTPPDPS